MISPIKEVKNSEIIYLDFNEIPKYYPNYKKIKIFFDDCKKKWIDPKKPENRQIFNINFLKKSKKTCLIWRYWENRIEMLKNSHLEKEWRTIHLWIDFFTKKQTNVYAVADGELIILDQEKEDHGFWYYAIIKHIINWKNIYSFYWHLAKHKRKLWKVKKWEIIGKLWNFKENWWWSIHLHFQLLKQKQKGIPIWYSTKKNLKKNKILFPDPTNFIII